MTSDGGSKSPRCLSWMKRNTRSADERSRNRHRGSIHARFPADRSPPRCPTAISPIIVELQVNGVSHRLTLDPKGRRFSTLCVNISQPGPEGLRSWPVWRARCWTAAASCLTLAWHDGQSITTIEGSPTMRPRRRRFIEHDACQCGYCTSGQICSAMGMLSTRAAQNARRATSRVGSALKKA